MNIEKIKPWNWFKKEEEQRAQDPQRGYNTPAYSSRQGYPSFLADVHAEVDRLFENAFRGFWSPGLGAGSLFDRLRGEISDVLLRPSIDIMETKEAYKISVEIPGVDEKDIRLELTDNALTIRGEKRREKEERDKNMHCMERSYGSFQRVLTLPEDADGDRIEAAFKNGILTVTAPRRSVRRPENVRRIDIKKAA